MGNESEPKVVLITGALSDIGRATAVSFANAHYCVALNHRHKEDQAREFSDWLVQTGHAPRAQGFQADVRYREQVSGMFDQACQTFGKVDVLVNNAGTNLDGRSLP